MKKQTAIILIVISLLVGGVIGLGISNSSNEDGGLLRGRRATNTVREDSSGNATTTADLVVGSESVNATTTLSVKTDGNPGSCIEMIDVGTNAAVAVYLNSGTFVATAGTCK